MRNAFVLLAALAGAALAAADHPTYQTIAGDPAKYKGQVVTFSYAFTRLQPQVNVHLAARGIKDDSHVEVQTPPRPLRTGGGVLILAARKNEALLAALRAFKPKDEVVFTGVMDSLTANTGAVFYHIDLASAAPAKKDKPPEKKKDEPKGEPEKTPGPQSKGEPAPTYQPVAMSALLEKPEAWAGKHVAVRLEFKGLGPQPPGWLAKAAGVDPANHATLAGTPRFHPIVPRTNKGPIAFLTQTKPGTEVILKGVVRHVSLGRLNVVALVVQEAGPAPPTTGKK